MKIVRCVFKVNSAEYPALITALVRARQSHEVIYTAPPQERIFITVKCPTLHAEQVVSDVASTLNLQPSKFPDEAPVSPAQLLNNQAPVQQDGLIQP